MQYYIILFFIMVIACVSITNSFYQQAKYLKVDQQKWVLTGLFSFIFITIPIWYLLKIFINSLLNNNYESINSTITFLVIAYYVKDFFYSKMKKDIKMPVEDEELLDDIEF